MTREELIEKMKGERILVDAEWLEENDSELLDWITSSEYWGRGYDYTPKREKAIVELQFEKGGVDYYADFEGSNIQDRWPSTNQPPWGEDEWENWDDEQLKAYYKELKKKEAKND